VRFSDDHGHLAAPLAERDRPPSKTFGSRTTAVVLGKPSG
jgi:hypothetical protein